MLDHLSMSRITTYNICSAKYAFVYVDRIKCPSRSPLLLGSSFHVAEAENDRQKIDTDNDLKVSDVCDLFSTQFDEGSHDVLWLPDEDKGLIKDTGYHMIEKYHEVITPEIHPAFVEQEFELMLSNGMKFTGVMDLITKDKKLIERKTKNRKPSNPDGDHKLQLVAYHAGYTVQKQEAPKEARIDYVISTKQPQALSYSVSVKDSDTKYLLSLISAVKDGIEKGVAIPNRSSMMCSRKYCAYSYECEKKFGGQVKGGDI
jgi:CRISPR/Cas system-associated exonuclease Cas4 (RecB family)